MPVLEGAVLQAKEFERQFLARDIAVTLAPPPKKACCGGSCGCGAKLQVLVREGDVQRVAQLMQEEWLEAVRREGTVADASLVPLKVEGQAEGGEPPCPACGTAAPLVAGACSDCGLQLE